jgi:hypothetical protein
MGGEHEIFGWLRDVEFLDQLNDYQLLKKETAPSVRCISIYITSPCFTCTSKLPCSGALISNLEFSSSLFYVISSDGIFREEKSG